MMPGGRRRLRKRYSIGSCLALAAVAWCLPAAALRQEIPGPIPARVVEVIDGDTLLVEARIWLDQVVVTRVRLDGVDAPELRAACERERAAALAARDYLGARIGDGGDPAGAGVVLHRIRWGKFAGRVLARVSTTGRTSSRFAFTRSRRCQSRFRMSR